MVQANIIKNIIKSRGSYSIFTRGNSMLPTIISDEKVTIIEPDNLIIGDIVLFEICNELVLHRIVEINEPYLVTQGDNHPYSDYYICKEQVIGKMEEKRNYKKNSQYNSEFTGITFVYWNMESLSNNLLFQLMSYGVEVEKETIIPNKVNVAIIPVAEKNINTLKVLINEYGSQNIAVHFNANISNSPREGYVELKEFNEYFRIGNRINNFLLSGEECMFLILGSLL